MFYLICRCPPRIFNNSCIGIKGVVGCQNSKVSKHQPQINAVFSLKWYIFQLGFNVHIQSKLLSTGLSVYDRRLVVSSNPVKRLVREKRA